MISSAQICPAKTTDAAEIAAIWKPILAGSLATFNPVVKSTTDIETMITDKADAGFAFLVAKDADGVLGFATYGQFRGGVGYARTMEHTIILADRAQGCGLGRQLMHAIEDHARTGGAHSIFAGVSAANQQGVAFHARLGYEEVARLPSVGYKFDKYLDLVLMQKFL